jgi:hypothetical protein
MTGEKTAGMNNWSFVGSEKIVHLYTHILPSIKGCKHYSKNGIEGSSIIGISRFWSFLWAKSIPSFRFPKKISIINYHHCLVTNVTGLLFKGQ